MKIAYLMIAHNTPNHLVVWSVRWIVLMLLFLFTWTRNRISREFRDQLLHRDVTLLKDRVAVYWGDFSDIRSNNQVDQGGADLLSQPRLSSSTKW